MSPPSRSWPTKALNILVPIVGIDLVIQYIAGLGTSAYAPANGFTMNTDFPIYDVHWLNGYALGVLSIILVLVAVFSRQVRNIAPAVVALAAVIVAAVAGMVFVNSIPNPPIATVTMGIAFLVAFSTGTAWMIGLRMSGTAPSSPPPSVPSPT